jgi:threonine dehydratase
MLCRVIERALVADGRLYRCTVLISDRAGGLAEFAKLVASTGASIKEVVHERAFASVPGSFSTAEVQVVLETRNHAHIHEIQELLRHSAIKFLYTPTFGRSSLRKVHRPGAR